jgi:GPI mannosyltransferase 1 subunit M
LLTFTASHSYGSPFLEHTYLYHVSRIDHRHNFSPYNMLLYLRSADETGVVGFRPESLAFVLQLSISCLLIPFVVAKKDLATSMMAQTYAFVTFNKVCTSQVRPIALSSSTLFM